MTKSSPVSPSAAAAPSPPRRDAHVADGAPDGADARVELLRRQDAEPAAHLGEAVHVEQPLPGQHATQPGDDGQRQMVAGAHPEAERVLARLLQRLDHAHQVGRGAAEAAAAPRLHLVEQARAEVEAELAGHAAAARHQREEVADAAGEVRRRVDEDAVAGLEAQRLGDVAGVARDGAQRLTDALGQARGAGREHDHRELVLGHGRELARGGGRSGFAAGPAHAVHQTVRVRRHDQAQGAVVRRRARLVGRQHDHVRLRLAHQPVDVVLREAGVERHHDLAGEPRAQHADEELVVLLEHQGDAGAAAPAAARRAAATRVARASTSA